jgi:hypothetical protein
MARASRQLNNLTRSDRQSEPFQSLTDSNPDRVAQRAYERYEARGREDGRDLEDWYEAERELRHKPSGSTTDGVRESDEQIQDQVA